MVGAVVAAYLADGAGRLSPGSIDFYRNGLAALPDTFRGRAVNEVTPLVLDSLYAELRAAMRASTRTKQPLTLARLMATKKNSRRSRCGRVGPRRLG